MPRPLLIFSQSDYLIHVVDTNSILTGKQCRSRSEANWSGSTLFARQDISGFSRKGLSICFGLQKYNVVRTQLLRITLHCPLHYLLGRSVIDDNSGRIFTISPEKHILWVILEAPQNLNEYPHHMFLCRNFILELSSITSPLTAFSGWLSWNSILEMYHFQGGLNHAHNINCKIW